MFSIIDKKYLFVRDPVWFIAIAHTIRPGISIYSPFVAFNKARTTNSLYAAHYTMDEAYPKDLISQQQSIAYERHAGMSFAENNLVRATRIVFPYGNDP